MEVGLHRFIAIHGDCLQNMQVTKELPLAMHVDVLNYNLSRLYPTFLGIFNGLCHEMHVPNESLP